MFTSKFPNHYNRYWKQRTNAREKRLCNKHEIHIKNSYQLVKEKKTLKMDEKKLKGQDK